MAAVFPDHKKATGLLVSWVEIDCEALDVFHLFGRLVVVVQQFSQEGTGGFVDFRAVSGFGNYIFELRLQVTEVIEPSFREIEPAEQFFGGGHARFFDLFAEFFF